MSPDEKYILLFNTRTGALLQIPHELSYQLPKYLHETIDTENVKKTRLFHILLQGGFLIDPALNEINEIRRLYSERLKSPLLHLSIMPTLACNMACSYCFEHHRNVSMNPISSDSILKFIKRSLPKIKKLEVNWYGGEPLLEVDFVISLQKQIVNLCQQFGVSSNFIMTTNGYLLTPEICDALVADGIQSFQVTVDGPKRIHDARRFLVNGDPSFERIISNLTYAVRIADVNLRVNVDRNNITYLEEMLDDLSNLGLQRIKSLSFKAVVPSGGIKTQDFAFAIPDFANAIRFYSEKAHKLGFNVFKESNGVCEFCPIDLPDQWIIGPDLQLFKCADAFDSVKDSVGYLAEDGTIHLNDAINLWQTKPIFKDPACRECIFLPMCMGGCSLKKLIHGSDWCPEERFDLQSYVKKLYSIRSKARI